MLLISLRIVRRIAINRVDVLGRVAAQALGGVFDSHRRNLVCVERPN